MAGEICKGDKVVFNTKALGYRHLTEEERTAWYNSDDSKGLDSAGEPRLCPTYTCYDLNEHAYTVVRARCAPMLAYYKRPNHCQIKTANGTLLYAKRTDIVGIVP